MFYAISLCGNQRFKIQNIQQNTFYQLAFNNISFNRKNWFVRKHNLAFFYAVNISRKFEIAQVFQKLIFEAVCF